MWCEWHALLRRDLRLEEQATSVCWAGLQCAARDIRACSFPSSPPVPTCTPSPETKTPTKSKEVAIAEESLVVAHMSTAAAATAAAGRGLCDDSNDSIK